MDHKGNAIETVLFVYVFSYHVQYLRRRYTVHSYNMSRDHLLRQ